MRPELITLVVASVLAAVVVVALVLRAERSRKRQADAELVRARHQIDALEQRLDEVSAEVAEVNRQRALDQAADREYVITTMGEVEQTDVAGAQAGRLRVSPPVSVARLAEQRLLASLARHQGGSRLHSSTVGVAVKVVAAGHGVRRALRPEVLDRAAAEAFVARRSSRRARRQELREARRLLRVVRSRQAAPQADEDAA